MAKIEVGEMPCPNEDCASHAKQRPVTIFLNDSTGALNYTCDKCGTQQYARAGQPVREAWIRRYCEEREQIIRAAEQRGKQEPAPAQNDPAPAPEPKAKKSGASWRQ